jgi:ribosomal protein S18 acetylase RimI-like enzyme
MDKTLFILRQYQPSDKEKIKKLYEHASIHSEIGYRSGPWESDFDDMEGVYFNGGDFLVGTIDDEIVAMGGLRKESDSVGYIRRMRVHPDFRRNGFAQQIIQGLEQSAKRNKLKELQLKTSKDQKMAQAFYEKNGFTRMSKKKSYYQEGGGKTFEEVWYKKELA